MKIKIFSLERTQSLWEHTVKYNLTDSGVHPLSLRELLSPEEMDELLALELGYSQTNGSLELRQAITGLYPGSSPDNILVTNGTAEANFLMTWKMVEPGDEILYMQPNYNQIGGLVKAFGGKLLPFHLKEVAGEGWRLDLKELEQQITPQTKIIALCNPNNPTGSVLREEEMQAIINLADRCGAWIYADEIYRGSELGEGETPSFWGKYDKVIIGAGLSKAYALSGLRIGWLVGPRDFIESAWAYHDYTTITAGLLSNYVGTIALRPENIAKIRRRSRSLLNSNLQFLNEWLARYPELFSLTPPQAGGMAFIKYHFSMNSIELITHLRETKSVFLAPGDCFGLDGFFRLGLGADPAFLQPGLQLFGEWLKENILT